MSRSVFTRRIPLPIFIATAVLVAGSAYAQSLITASVIASGGGRSQSPGACYALDATLGEPAGGRSTGGAFALATGYQAGAGGYRRDQLFRNGFQECD